MSDLGQDVDSLKLKLMEAEHSIAQMNLAKKTIELEKARLHMKLRQYASSHADIDNKILEHEKSVESFRQAIDNLKA